MSFTEVEILCYNLYNARWYHVFKNSLSHFLLTGSYGVIDETGHKRIVHYSSGKGNFLPQAAQKSTVTPFPTTQEQSNLLMQQNFNTFSQQQSIFKPANYLQSRATRPVNIEPIRLTPQKEFILKKQKPVEKIKKSVTPVYKSAVPTSRVNIIQPAYKSSMSVPTEQATVSTTPLPTMSEAQPGSISALSEMYKSLKRVPKTTSIPKKLSTIANKMYADSGKSYESATEEYYYDSAPAFVDIERLSYSIGTDKSSSV